MTTNNKTDEINLIDLFFHLWNFIKRKTILVFVFLIICLAVPFGMYKLTPQFYNYEMILNSGNFDHGDLLLNLRKMNSHIKKGNFNAISWDWSENKNAIQKVEVLKQYGSISDNLIYKLRLTDSSLVSKFENNFLDYLNNSRATLDYMANAELVQTQRIIEIENELTEIEANDSIGVLKMDEFLITTESDVELANLYFDLGKELELVKNADFFPKGYYIVSSFSKGPKTADGPELIRYLCFGLIGFFICFILLFYINVRKVS